MLDRPGADVKPNTYTVGFWTENRQPTAYEKNWIKNWKEDASIVKPVNFIESQTGYNFFANIPSDIQERIEGNKKIYWSGQIPDDFTPGLFGEIFNQESASVEQDSNMPEMQAISAEELLTRYAAGERDFPEVDLRDANLTGADLRGINLSNAWLQGTDFSGADLSGAILEWADLEGVEMIGTNLSGANLKNACLSPASFEGANFSAADLTNVTLYASNLENALLIGANLTNADLEAAVFDGADFTNANLTDAKKFGYGNAIYRNTTMPDGSIRSDDI